MMTKRIRFVMILKEKNGDDVYCVSSASVIVGGGEEMRLIMVGVH